MSLISEINRTETNKNKTKTVANNIDNKLVELGGEQVESLADIPNKIEVVENQYLKIAEIKNLRIWINTMPQTITFNKLSFKPKKVMVLLSYGKQDLSDRSDMDWIECSDSNNKIHSLTDSSFVFADDRYKKDTGWNPPRGATIKQLIFMG